MQTSDLASQATTYYRQPEPPPTLPAGTVTDAVIRFAGNSQDGIQAIGGFLARLAGRSEQDVMTFMTIPSTISGGPSIFQVRIGSGEVLSAGDECDVLIAFYQHSYEGHLSSLKKGGIVIYDTSHVEPKEEWKKDYKHVGVPISSNTIEAIGGTAKDKGKNMFALGLVAHMFNLNQAKLEKLISERFGNKDASVLTNALNAFHAGAAYSLGDVIQTFKFVESPHAGGPQVVMSGNEALAYGLLAAGVRFGAAYPITPWTEVMEIMRRELPKYGGIFVQCEDEIASVSTALGASFAGRVAVTGSSGPGISLKSEGISWAVMAEVPLVIVDVQRGGPSTGMPTNVEQSDLNIACYGGHGDAPRVVLAPANVEDCFYTAIEAVKIAQAFNVPVIILSDQSIATRIEAFPEPDLPKVCADLTPQLKVVDDYKPYDLDAADGVTEYLPPGTRILSGNYPIRSGLEHDEYGHPTASPKLHQAMTEKRRRKLQRLSDLMPTPKVYGPEKGDILLVGWGSTVGPIREATDRYLAEGERIASVHVRHLHPLPRGLNMIFENYRRIVVIEMNDEGVYGYGQFAALLRAKFLDSRILSLTKTDGLTWKVKEIRERLRPVLNRLHAQPAA